MAVERLAGQCFGDDRTRRYQSIDIDAGVEPHRLEQEHEILGDDVAGGARCVGAAADTALRGLSPDRVEGTALWDAVVVSASKLSDQSYPGRVLILLTDQPGVPEWNDLAGQAGAIGTRSDPIAPCGGSPTPSPTSTVTPTSPPPVVVPLAAGANLDQCGNDPAPSPRTDCASTTCAR